MKFIETTKNGKPVFKIDGKVVTKAVFDKAMTEAQKCHRPGKSIGRPRGMKRGYPIVTKIAGTTSHGAQELRDECVKRGVPTEVKSTGQVVWRDAAHRRAYLKAFGQYDRNSYNGY